jgi:DNA-binding PadR family transcriptional regulator
MLRELRQHGYDISPGILYPILQRMTQVGWLSCEVEAGGGLRTRRYYTLTSKRREAFAVIRKQFAELRGEVLPSGAKGKS